MTPSVIREEEKENSSQSDDIFYTCPQIDESTRKVGLAFSYHVIYEIEDFSTNGTFLNGERLEKNKRIPLKDGDQIGIIGQEEPRESGVKIILGYMFRDIS